MIASASVTLDAESERKLRKLQRVMPSVYRRACGRAAAGARRQISSIIKQGGGKNGVPTFAAKSDVTLQLHGRGRFFGQLGNANQIKSWKRDGGQFIGWPDGRIGDFVASLQEASRGQMSDGTRHYMHVRGVDDVPQFYSRPARHVIDPYAKWLAAGAFSKWTVSAAEKLIQEAVR